VFGHKKSTSQKNFFPLPNHTDQEKFFPVTNHTGQENFLKLPKKSFFSNIFIFTCFFNFFPMSLIIKNKNKCVFLVLPVFGHKKRASRKNFFSVTNHIDQKKFFPVSNQTGQENFLKLPKKSFFSKIFIFTCFFSFFIMSLIRKKKVRFFSFAGVWSQKTHKSKKFFSSTKPHKSRKFFETTKEKFFQ
jgi:hypothetical protein